MKRPCLACGRLIERGSHCPEHEPRSPWKMRSGGAQQRFRQKLIRQYGALRCLACGAPDSAENPVEASHEYELSMGGPMDGPGALLCRRCHRAMDGAARRARRRT